MAAMQQTATLIDGKATAAVLRAEVGVHTAKLMAEKSVTPGLAVVLVGARPDSVSDRLGLAASPRQHACLTSA